MIAPSAVAGFLLPGDGGWDYVLGNGRTVIPFPFGDLFTARCAQYLCPHGATRILLVTFNLPDSYRGSENRPSAHHCPRRSQSREPVL